MADVFRHLASICRTTSATCNDHLVRLQQSADNLRDMVSTAISVNLSLVTPQENEIVGGLRAYASLIAVPTLDRGRLRDESSTTCRS